MQRTKLGKLNLIKLKKQKYLPNSLTNQLDLLQKRIQTNILGEIRIKTLRK